MTPFFARSVGFFPVFFSSQGGLGHAAIHAQPLPVDALEAVVVQQPLLPKFEENASFDPLLVAVVGSGTGAELGGVKGFPLATRAQDLEDGIGTGAIRSTGSSAAKAMGVDMLGKEHFQEFPKLIGDAPVVGHLLGVHR